MVTCCDGEHPRDNGPQKTIRKLFSRDLLLFTQPLKGWAGPQSRGSNHSLFSDYCKEWHGVSGLFYNHCTDMTSGKASPSLTGKLLRQERKGFPNVKEFSGSLLVCLLPFLSSCSFVFHLMCRDADVIWGFGESGLRDGDEDAGDKAPSHGKIFQQ